MRGTRWVLLVLVSAVLGSGPVWGADISEAYRADIERLMLVTGSARLGTQMATAVTEKFVSAVSETTPGFSPRAIEITTEVMQTHFEREFRCHRRLVQTGIGRGDIPARLHAHRRRE